SPAIRLCRDPDRLFDCRVQSKTENPEGLEIEPGVLVEIVDDGKVCGAEHRVIVHPDHVELAPHRGLELDRVAHHPFGQILLADEFAPEKGGGKQPIYYGRLPLDEEGITEEERYAA